MQPGIGTSDRYQLNGVGSIYEWYLVYISQLLIRWYPCGQYSLETIMILV